MKRRPFAIITAVALVAGIVAAQAVAWRTKLERQFMPGPTGHVAGARSGGIGARAFRTRAMSGIERIDGGREWAEANGLTSRPNFSHNLARIFSPELYATHPEFFPLVDGKRFRPPEGPASWNPDLGREDVAAFAAEAARRYFAEQPESDSFAVGVNDGLMFGESAETLAALGPLHWFRERPDFSNLVYGFTNRVAEKVFASDRRKEGGEEETRPSEEPKYIGALAYYWAENAPEFPLEPHVMPFLTADRSQGYDRAFLEEEALLQRRWARVASEGAKVRRGILNPPDAERRVKDNAPYRAAIPRRLGLYDYLYGQGFLVPRVTPHFIAANLRQARRAGFTDYYAEVNPNWGLDGPMPWLVAQLLQDPEQSPEVLLEEYYARSFGAAAVAMRRFFERCERQWRTQTGPAYWLKHFRNESQAALFPRQVCRELRGLLDDARRAARTEAERQRVASVSDAFGVTERFVAMQESRDRLNRAAFGTAAWREIAAELAVFLAARRDFVDYTAELQARTPLAVAPFNGDDYLRHDPASNAVLALLERARTVGEKADAEAALASVGALDVSVAALERATQDGVRRQDLVRDGGFAGAVRSPMRVAGLDYSVGLPAAWLSSVEPVQFQKASLQEKSSEESLRVLRLSGNKETSVYQWNPVVEIAASPDASAPPVYMAQVRVRAAVSPSNSVSLVLSWLDEEQRRIAVKTLRLPEGEWTNGVTLRVAAHAPPGARWVGIGVRVQHQQRDDWAEFSDLHLWRF